MSWDAATYDALPLPHVAWGRWARGRLDLQGHEHVLDVGCGTGRDLQDLLEQHPALRATALDRSGEMLARARERLARHGDRVRFLQADVTQPLALEEPADAAFSVAALHWVADHEAAFRALHAALAPGAPLVVDAGGHGNIARTRAAIEAAGEDPEAYVHFATPHDTRERLEAAGFEVLEASLVAAPTTLPDRPTFERFLRTIVLGRHVAERGEEERARIIAEVADGLPGLSIDYVRLRVVARRR
ncbi:trans-aconitate 2-methyltransferase [Conexibacter sp. SYSU D00693]|uniref:class I SAM-dependent methyltransferase n=1 Tax=Conexibacter sp. SYSU D00693 TaxID=2812560 RepID=UPI00196A9A8F|nr:class I SAM-dependent methyltransferase [Conexibacter sp. SYSU D00693]